MAGGQGHVGDQDQVGVGCGPTRRDFASHAIAGLFGALVAVPFMGDSAQASRTSPFAVLDKANTFTASQVIQSPKSPLTVTGSSLTSYPFKVVDLPTGRPLVAIQNIAAGIGEGSRWAGAISFCGSHGVGADGAAWTLGVDVAVAPYDQDFFIGKINGDDTVRDVVYIHGNQKAATQLELFPTGIQPTAGVTISGQNAFDGDPLLLQLRPSPGLEADALEIRQLGDDHGTLTIGKHGEHAWGPGGSVPPDTNLVRAEAGDLRVQRKQPGIVRSMTLENGNPATDGDGVRFALAADGFDVAYIDGAYDSSIPAGSVSFKVRTSSAAQQAERICIDAQGTRFQGAVTVNGGVASSGGITANGASAINDRLLVRRSLTIDPDGDGWELIFGSDCSLKRAAADVIGTSDDIEFLAVGKGPIVRSEDGSAHRIVVDNVGALSTLSV